MKRFNFLILLFFVSIQVFLVKQTALGNILLDRVVATVNNDVITWSELRKSIALENEALLSGLSHSEKEQKIKEIEKPFLNNLIDVKLQLQEAVRLGLAASPAETNEAINDIKKKFNLTDESLREYLKADGLTLKEYRSRLREQILLSKVIRYEIMDTILVTDKNIDEFYEANKEKYRQDVKIRIRQILFTDTNSLQKAEEVFQRIKKGEDFEKLAADFSEDASKTFGGDLGYVSRGSMVKEIEDVAFSLKVGEVSKPFQSPKGIHIIKIEDRLENAAGEKVREQIKRELFEKAYQSKFENWLKELREKAYIEINL
ncbi:MAG: peptidylprolyl isomerase [Thermodesulfovibrionia bacterium]|nr:peptidylprolyl isomerase [Thermodesulfovibrionia bacterium]